MKEQKLIEDLKILNGQIVGFRQNLDNMIKQFQNILRDYQKFNNPTNSIDFPVNDQISQYINDQKNYVQEQDFNIQEKYYDHREIDFNINFNQLKNVEKRGKYNKYPQHLKEKAISLVNDQKIPIKIVAQRLKIPLKNLTRWLEHGPIRKKGGGRKIQDYSMEIQLRDWMIQQKHNNQNICPRTIKKMAKTLVNQRFKSTFKASKGWLEKFLKRNNISDAQKQLINEKSIFEQVISMRIENFESFFLDLNDQCQFAQEILI